MRPDSDPVYPQKTIGELAVHVGSGATPRGGSEVYLNDGVLFIRSQNVRSEGLNLKDVVYIDQHTHASMRRSEIFANDVLLNITGASIGRCCTVPDGLGAANVNQHVCAIRVKDATQGDASFLSSVLSSHIGQQQIERLNAGGNREGLNYQQLRKFAVPWPAGQVRQVVAEILDTVDEAIRKAEAIIAKLGRVKQGLLHDLLTRGIDENGQLRDPDRHPEQFKDSPLGRIPKEWQILAVDEIAGNVPGATTIGPFGSDLVASDYQAAGTPVVFVRDIRASGFVWNSEVYLTTAKAKELSKHSVQPGDVVVTKMGDPPGTACVYPGWMPPGVITADVIRIRVNVEHILPEWLSNIANASVFQSQVRATMGGVTRSKLTLRDFRTLVLPVPGLTEQSRIVDTVSAIGQRITREAMGVRKLQLLKQGLMDDLLTCRVRVADLLQQVAK